MAELRAMLKKNKIRGYLHYNKSELIDVLIKRGFPPETVNITTITERENTKKEITPKYNFLKNIRKWSKEGLRSEILKRMKLLYVLLCIRPLTEGVIPFPVYRYFLSQISFNMCFHFQLSLAFGLISLSSLFLLKAFVECIISA